MSEEFKGKMKEAYGAMTGDEGKKAEGQAQQRAAAAAKEAGQKERDRQERKDKGLLGNVGDTLSGR